MFNSYLISIFKIINFKKILVKNKNENLSGLRFLSYMNQIIIMRIIRSDSDHESNTLRDLIIPILIAIYCDFYSDFDFNFKPSTLPWIIWERRMLLRQRIIQKDSTYLLIRNHCVNTFSRTLIAWRWNVGTIEERLPLREL